MTAVTSTSSSTGPALVVNGLVSGLTTPKVIEALLQAYQEPITNLQNQQAMLNSEASDYRTLATALQALQTAAQALNTKSQWNLATATSSNTSVATAIASAGAQTGSLTFTVNQLAQANVLDSTGAVASEGQTVTSASSVLVSTGAAAIGFSNLTGGAGLALGAFDVTVTQASAAAAVTGTALATTVHVAATSTLTLDVNGTTQTVKLAGGTYTPASLAAATGVDVQATVAATGGIRLATDRQGATATISVTGGTALAALGLTTGKSGTGTDAVVTVGGVSNTLSKITPDAVLTLQGPGGATVAATVAGAPGHTGSLVSAGTAHADNVSTGNGSLTQLVAAINSSGLAATATAVQLTSGDYILQVSADATGTAGSVSVASGAFSGSPLGRLQTIANAQDATLTVGGAHGYTLSSATDTFTNLLPGTSVTVASAGTATVTVSPDAAGEATRVANLVAAANKVLADVKTYAGYTATTKTGGPLMGDAVVTDLKQQIVSLFGSVGGTSTLGNLASVGVSLSKTGTGSITFTRQKFTTAFNANPSEVADLFIQGASYSPSSTANAADVAFAFAGTSTLAGTYAVVVSHSATQAVDKGGAVSGGSVSTPETLTVKVGSATATYTTTSGETLANVADGLNNAFAGAGLALAAQVVTGTHLEIVSNGYGTSSSFSVTSTATGTGTTGLGGLTPETFTGTNVAGTIGGFAATGTGQTLTAPAGSSPAAGLAIVVSAPDITTTTALGTISYRPGAAQQIAAAANDATNVQTGSITSAVKALTTQATGLNARITMYEKLEDEQRALLQKEFTTMETNLEKLQNEGSMLSQQIKKLTSTL
jgi:flagellar hook-associated protein 2